MAFEPELKRLEFHYFQTLVLFAEILTCYHCSSNHCLLSDHYKIAYQDIPVSTTMKQAFSRLSFLRQFMLLIFAVLVIGMMTIGTWMGWQIESSAVNRAAAISAVYVESIMAAQIHSLPNEATPDSELHAALDRLFVEGPLSRKVVRFKLWDANGRIIYSDDHSQLGLYFPVKNRLAAAFTGTLQARISNLDEEDNRPEKERWSRLLEIYVPARFDSQGKITSVAEFYLSVENLERDIRAAKQRSWLFVAIASLVFYLLLFGLVRRASRTIHDQQRDLRHQLQQLRTALDENDRMREQLHKAGVNTTTLNEEFLIRIAADLHDGPAQAIAFALMRFDEFSAAFKSCTSPPGGVAQDFRSIRDALQSSLQDVRKISSGLAMPGIAELSLADTARRAVHDFERMSRQTVQAEIGDTLNQPPLAVKITVYRLIQESLNNSWRHAPGGAPQVRMQQTDDQVLITITDHGAGFDFQAAAVAGRLGLNFMRERVRLLGGTFEVDSAPGRGTCIRARLPLSTDEVIHA